jgi:CRP/FNR family transcriptional regulator, cyclic AMP receptor protein
MEKPSAKELAELLSWVEFLEPLSEEEQGWLTGRLTCTTLEANETFVVGPEEHAERMVLVLRGQLQVYESDPSGREMTLAVLEGGTSVGATGLVPRTPRELRVRILEPTLLCYLRQGDLERLARANPEVGLALARMLAGRLVWMEARWADLAAKEVSARLASMLLLLIESEGVVTPEGYRIPTRYTHQQIASMIGANRESTTKAFGRLQEEGGVELKERYVYVTDVEALKRASG